MFKDSLFRGVIMLYNSKKEISFSLSKYLETTHE